MPSVNSAPFNFDQKTNSLLFLILEPLFLGVSRESREVGYKQQIKTCRVSPALKTRFLRFATHRYGREAHCWDLSLSLWGFFPLKAVIMFGLEPADVDGVFGSGNTRLDENGTAK